MDYNKMLEAMNKAVGEKCELEERFKEDKQEIALNTYEQYKAVVEPFLCMTQKELYNKVFSVGSVNESKTLMKRSVRTEPNVVREITVFLCMKMGGVSMTMNDGFSTFDVGMRFEDTEDYDSIIYSGSYETIMYVLSALFGTAERTADTMETIKTAYVAHLEKVIDVVKNHNQSLASVLDEMKRLLAEAESKNTVTQDSEDGTVTIRLDGKTYKGNLKDFEEV